MTSPLWGWTPAGRLVPRNESFEAFKPSKKGQDMAKKKWFGMAVVGAAVAGVAVWWTKLRGKDAESDEEFLVEAVIEEALAEEEAEAELDAVVEAVVEAEVDAKDES
jgi:hypothetical protein